jgi:hypothetical protein
LDKIVPLSDTFTLKSDNNCPKPLVVGQQNNIIRINSWFNRRNKTKFNDKETKALKAIGDIDQLDMAVLEEYYTSGYKYLRRDIQTLLNNWSGEIDRANKWKSDRMVSDFDNAKNKNMTAEDLF